MKIFIASWIVLNTIFIIYYIITISLWIIDRKRNPNHYDFMDTFGFNSSPNSMFNTSNIPIAFFTVVINGMAALVISVIFVSKML